MDSSLSFQTLLRPEVREFIREHQHDDVSKLALQARQFTGLPLPEILAQISARKKARTKLPGWYAHECVIFPPLLNLEQSSSELTGRYKASLLAGDTLVDLTGGFGIDAFCFAARFGRVMHVEQNAELSLIAQHNAQCMELPNLHFAQDRAESFLERIGQEVSLPVDVLYLDPARRLRPDQTSDRSRVGEKVFRLEDCEPDVLQLLPSLLRNARQVLVKTSPMLDIEQAIRQLRAVRAVTVVAVDNECKEVLYHLAESGAPEPELRAVQLQRNGTASTFAFTRSEEQQTIAEISPPKTYLYEPHAALLKAGAFRLAAQRYGLAKLHPHTHLYTSDTLRTDFPGRIFRCEATVRMDKKELLAQLPEKKANIAVRNFPMTVAEIRKKTGIREGGDAYLFAVTDAQDRKVVLVTRKVEEG